MLFLRSGSSVMLKSAFSIHGIIRKMLIANCASKNMGVKDDIKQIFLNSVASVKTTKIIREKVILDITTGQIKVGESVISSNRDVYLVGFGKAVYGMTLECQRILGSRLKRGIISVPEGIDEVVKDQIQPSSNITVYTGAKNNLPDEKSLSASIAISELASSLTERDVLLVLISGGGSALLPLPVPEISLTDKINTIKLVSSVGADITELNTVRKKLSVIKGGGLAEMAYPAEVHSLILSDIVNDPLDFIASAPTLYNTDSSSAALEVIGKYRLEFKLPRHVLQAIKKNKILKDIPVCKNEYVHVNNNIIGNVSLAIDGAVQTCKHFNYNSIIFSSAVEGLVFDVARTYTSLALLLCKILNKELPDVYNAYYQFIKSTGVGFSIQPQFVNELLNITQGNDNLKTLCIIGGGETTVKVGGVGKGGRNQELALWFSQYLKELEQNNDFLKKFDILLLAAGTDGIDGPTEVAGAIGGTVIADVASANSLDIDSYLANNDSYTFFSQVDNGSYFIKTGHTDTNVMDIHVLLISKK